MVTSVACTICGPNQITKLTSFLHCRQRGREG